MPYRLSADFREIIECDDWQGPVSLAQDTYCGVRVSTIFLGVEVSGGLFETMVFGGDHDGLQFRKSTITTALAVHDAVLLLVKGLTPPPALIPPRLKGKRKIRVE